MNEIQPRCLTLVRPSCADFNPRAVSWISLIHQESQTELLLHRRRRLTGDPNDFTKSSYVHQRWGLVLGAAHADHLRPQHPGSRSHLQHMRRGFGTMSDSLLEHKPMRSSPEPLEHMDEYWTHTCLRFYSQWLNDPIWQEKDEDYRGEQTTFMQQVQT